MKARYIQEIGKYKRREVQHISQKLVQYLVKFGDDPLIRSSTQ